MQMVGLDRKYLQSVEWKARRAKAENNPLKYVSTQADAANQTAFALLMCSPWTHGTDK